MAKKIFTNQIDEKSLVLLSLYFFQPILIFWGLTKTPINFEFVISPFIYLVAVLISLFLLLLFNKQIFKERTDQSIYLATALVSTKILLSQNYLSEVFLSSPPCPLNVRVGANSPSLWPTMSSVM